MTTPKEHRPGVLGILLVRLRFLMIFVVIGALVANWDWLMSRLDRYTRPARTNEASGGDTEWYCPMHPNVIRAQPSNCPTCGMSLSQRKKGKTEALPPGAVARLQLSPYRVHQARIATEEIEYRPLVREIRTVGFIAYDERRLTDLSARIAGRVDVLHVNFKGTRVKAGDPLYEIYSPELVTTEEEYLLAMKALDEVSSQPQHDRDSRVRATRLAEAARVRLRLWGVTDDQVAELEKSRKTRERLTIHSPVSGVVLKKEINTGRYIQVGEAPFTIADDSVVWLQAEVFERDMPLIVAGSPVEIASEAYPGQYFFGAVSFVQPEVDPTTRTVKVRVDVDNHEGRLKAGMYVTSAFRLSLGKVEELPPEAAAAAAPPPPTTPAQKIYVCDMHREQVFNAPGKCEKCGGMELEPRDIPAGSRLVYTCPDHPTVVSDKPGVCPQDNKPLQYRIVAEPAQEVVAWSCPIHPAQTAKEKAVCPISKLEMKLFRRENVLAVPVTSVIDSGARKTVFLERGPGVYEAVEVLLGPRAGDYFQVLGGLQRGDRVVAQGAFLLDAEANLNPGAAGAYFGATGHEAHR